jgi:hypothetical protein
MIGQGAPNFPNGESNSQHRPGKYARCSLRIVLDHELTQHTGNRTPIWAINAFSDDMLFKILSYCRQILSDEHEADDNHKLEGSRWEDERWWYELVHVCRKWRFLVFASASRLRLRLYCTYNTPVADVLTFQPALPLIIDYGDQDREVTAQDEEGMLLALRRRRRVYRARLWIPAPSLRRLLATMDVEFPMLEHLYLNPLTNDDNDLALPVSFHAPHLRHFVVRNIFFPPFVFRPPPAIPHIPSTDKSSQSVLYYGPQLWRCASFRCYLISLWTNADPWTTDR